MSILFVDDIRGKTTTANVKLPVGCVLQVLQGERLTIQSNSSNTYADVVTQAITPKFNTSKILIIYLRGY